MKLKKIFTTGLLTLLPLGVTVYVFYLIFNVLDSLLGGIFVYYLGFRVPGIGFAAGIVLIFMVGLVASNLIGRKLLAYGDLIFRNLPLARSIYSSAKQIIDAFTVQGKNAFQQVVLLEYPRPGLYVLGFITGESRGEIQEKTREEVLNIFIPTTPNPTSGMLILAPRKEVLELEMSVEDAMKVIVSGGLVSPSGNASLPAPEKQSGPDS